MSQIRVLIAGGGTGGHIIPALAVARELEERHGAEVLFVGTPRGLESRLVPNAGFKLELIKVGQLNRVSLQTQIRTLFDLPLAAVSCFRLLWKFRPGVVLSVGGYASGPAAAAALLNGTPVMALEPNAMPGLANRLIGRHVKAAAVNFPAAGRYLRNAEVTGIPVRPEFFSLPAPPPMPPRLLIFGGSQGARLFNNTMPKIVAELFQAVPGLSVLHQSGPRFLAETEAMYRASGADPLFWSVKPFLDDMASRFAWANIVLARSGASTVAELAAAGKPSLLVPFAAAADDHQKRNAEEMVRAGAAAMLEETDLAEPKKLLEVLTGLLRDPERLAAMSAAARTQAHPDAAQRIAAKLVQLAKRP
ncbi:undecaprenyldiphospho-muramoylpentapeptide beta-N-acetylglucosaminyltransferase [Occallatibacter riparius]|uniref:undecaprenyldiphospho-muramoylpentapeptide beta-N-acetylglucosaminyltransferase n=1 Tax=Occallatibacter riparius TaxID=1002689 RepID=UPI0028C3DF7A|nr:undecaprenyldiphospho-muramoylpentapeptide beta-N-acetylglucosaminyltransferase [Occallatibacter riparius]